MTQSRFDAAEAAVMVDWLLKEYVNAYSGIAIEWDQARYDAACELREALEEAGARG